MAATTGEGAITTAFVQDYKSTVELLLQQKGSRLRGSVTSDSYVGKAGTAVEQFGPAEATKKTSRNMDTPNLDVPQDKRWVYPVDYIWAKLCDSTDKLRMIVDPTNPFAVNGANAMLRAYDDEIIGSFFASANVGENGTSSETFDTTNYQVGVNTGGTASSINVAKLQEALRMLMTAFKGEVDEMIFCAIGPFEHDALLKEIQVTSKDFNGGQPVLVDGRIRRFMGMEFIITDRLDISSGNRRIPVWVPSGMHLGIWQDLVADIGKRRDKSGAWQVQLDATIGATRLQQGKVIEIQCDDQI